MRQYSLKRARDNRIYVRKAKAFLENKFCFCGSVATQVHHVKGRIGALLLDENNWLAVCALHHDEIERNPNWAKNKGYSKSRLHETD